jgi:hypothetical protein
MLLLNSDVLERKMIDADGHTDNRNSGKRPGHSEVPLLDVSAPESHDDRLRPRNAARRHQHITSSYGPLIDAQISSGDTGRVAQIAGLNAQHVLARAPAFSGGVPVLHLPARLNTS